VVVAFFEDHLGSQVGIRATESLGNSIRALTLVTEAKIYQFHVSF
jgi:hypothetical protein